MAHPAGAPYAPISQICTLADGLPSRSAAATTSMNS
jgi:hypothetical protein